MEKPPISSHLEPLSDDGPFEARLSDEKVAQFLNEVNEAAGEHIAELDDTDMLIALTGLYWETYAHPEDADFMTERVIVGLEHGRPSELARKLGTTMQNLRNGQRKAATIMAREFKIARDARVDPNNFSAHQVDIFGKLIDAGKLFSRPLDDDEVRGTIDLYARKRLESDHEVDPIIFGRQITGVLRRLEGHSWADIATELGVKLTDVSNDYHAVTSKIRQALGELATPPSTQRFNFKKGEKFRRQINEYAGKELLVGPLDDEKLFQLLGVYVNIFPDSRDNVGTVTTYLEGKTMRKIANETGVSPPSQVQIKAHVAETIAVETERAFDKDVFYKEINAHIKFLNKNKTLSDRESLLFAQHVGSAEKSDEDSIWEQQREVCEKIRLLLENKEGHIVWSRKDENLHSAAHSRIIKRLLGHRSNPVRPMPGDQLIKEFNDELQDQYQQGAIDRKTLIMERKRYELFVLSTVSKSLKYLCLPEYTP